MNYRDKDEPKICWCGAPTSRGVNGNFRNTCSDYCAARAHSFAAKNKRFEEPVYWYVGWCRKMYKACMLGLDTPGEPPEWRPPMGMRSNTVYNRVGKSA